MGRPLLVSVTFGSQLVSRIPAEDFPLHCPLSIVPGLAGGIYGGRREWLGRTPRQQAGRIGLG